MRHPPSPRPAGALQRVAPVLAAAAALAASFAATAATPAEQLDRYRSEAGTPPSVDRGRQFFTTAHGREWSCSSCHGTLPVGDGRHAATGRTIRPMAPAANPERFTDAAKTEKWFRRNCHDVLGRECTPGEKADVLAWLQGLRP